MAKVNADSFQNHKSDRMKKSLEYSKCDSCKEYRRNWEKNKYNNNEEYRKKCIENVVKKEKKLLENDTEFKIKHLLRCRMRKAIKAMNAEKNFNTLELTGCSIPFLKEHLEKQFKQGMTWDNHTTDGWHIDHIRPCCSFDLTKKEQQEECFHYTNLQPLWATDNLKKGGAWDY